MRASLRASFWTTGALALAGLAATSAAAQQADAVGAGEAQRTLSTIDWDAARRDAQAAGVRSARPVSSRGLVGFAGVQRAGVEQLQIPMLLPLNLVNRSRVGDLDETMRVAATATHYSANAREPGRSYLIQGTRVVFQSASPVVSAEEDTLAGPAVIDQTEYGMEISFERYNAVYSITIFCDEPETDAACTDDALVRDLAAQMTFTE